MPGYRPLCPLCRHGVLCVKKHIKAQSHFYTTKAARLEIQTEDNKQGRKKSKKAGNVMQALMAALLLYRLQSRWISSK